MSDESLLEQIIESNPYGFLLTDGDGRPVRWNSACVRLFGVHPSPPAGYSVLRDPVLLQAGFGPALARVGRGERIEPIEAWYDPHDVDPTVPSRSLCLRSTISPLTDETGRVTNLVIMHEDVTARKKAEQMYQRREAILQAIAWTAQVFLGTRDWQLSMPAVLGELGQATGVSEAYLFRCTENGWVRLAAHWSRTGSPPSADDRADHPAGNGPFGRWNRLLAAGGIVNGLPADFPTPERTALEKRGVRSVLQIPVVAGGVFWGFIGFNDSQTAHAWSEGEIAALRTLAGLIGSTVDRTRLEQELEQTKAQLERRVAERTEALLSANQTLEQEMAERVKTVEQLRLLSAAVQQSTEGLAVSDTHHRILFVNRAFAVMHGMEPDDLTGQPISIFYSPEQYNHAVVQVERKVRRAGRFQGVAWHTRASGEAFPALMGVSPLRDDANRLIGFISTALDITEQMEAEAERKMMARAVQNVGEGIAVFNAAWKLHYANPELVRILGRRKPADILGCDWGDLFAFTTPGQRDDIESALETRKRWAGRLLARGRQDRTIPVALTLVRMHQPEGESLVVANVRDRSAEEAHLAQVRKLTLDAARSLEDERARLSRELHDEVGQTLTAINLNLAWLHSRSQGWDPAAQERLAESKQFVNRMLDSIRTLSTSLRPPILDNRGLLEAIRSYAGEFSRRAGIACRVVATPSDLEVPDPVATTLFRILQEAMTNIARHSEASRAGIFLKLYGHSLEFKIRDNGVGAVPKRLEGVQSLGIAGMRERAASVGGALSIENRPEGGLCVTVRLPWQQA